MPFHLSEQGSEKLSNQNTSASTFFDMEDIDNIDLGRAPEDVSLENPFFFGDFSEDFLGVLLPTNPSADDCLPSTSTVMLQDGTCNETEPYVYSTDHHLPDYSTPPISDRSAVTVYDHGQQLPGNSVPPISNRLEMIDGQQPLHGSLQAISDGFEVGSFNHQLSANAMLPISDGSKMVPSCSALPASDEKGNGSFPSTTVKKQLQDKIKYQRKAEGKEDIVVDLAVPPVVRELTPLDHERREAKKKKNKESAKKSRDKKKIEEKQLKEDYVLLVKENEELKTEIQSLWHENALLEGIVVKHRCDCKLDNHHVYQQETNAEKFVVASGAQMPETSGNQGLRVQERIVETSGNASGGLGTVLWTKDDVDAISNIANDLYSDDPSGNSQDHPQGNHSQLATSASRHTEQSAVSECSFENSIQSTNYKFELLHMNSESLDDNETDRYSTDMAGITLKGEATGGIPPNNEFAVPQSGSDAVQYSMFLNSSTGASQTSLLNELPAQTSIYISEDLVSQFTSLATPGNITLRGLILGSVPSDISGPNLYQSQSMNDSGSMRNAFVNSNFYQAPSMNYSGTMRNSVSRPNLYQSQSMNDSGTMRNAIASSNSPWCTDDVDINEKEEAQELVEFFSDLPPEKKRRLE